MVIGRGRRASHLDHIPLRKVFTGTLTLSETWLRQVPTWSILSIIYYCTQWKALCISILQPQNFWTSLEEACRVCQISAVNLTTAIKRSRPRADSLMYMQLIGPHRMLHLCK